MSFSEDILLLALDDDTGRLRPMPGQTFVGVMAGAMLFDLAFGGQVDNDIHQLFLVDCPGEPPAHLRHLLDTLSAQGGPMALDHALAIAAMAVPLGMERLFDRLVESGVLSRSRRFSARHADSYAKADWTRVVSLRRRIREAVLSDALPDSRDVVSVALLHASGLDSLLFSHDELNLRKDRLASLLRMEALAPQMLKAVEAARDVSHEDTAGRILGREGAGGGGAAGGVDAVVSAMGHVRRALGLRRGMLALANINQPTGFDCPSCAWPEAEQGCSRLEFCENGAKALASEAAGRVVDGEFFSNWSLADLAAQSDHWLETRGRLAVPLIREQGASHYRAVTYEEAYGVIARELRTLDAPDQAVFYASGTTENEPAFVFQLLARSLGTNNLPNSISLCHEPSGTGMVRSLGFGKGDADLHDFEKAGAIFLFGHNPGSNHPRMLKTLQAAARNGADIVAVNPMPEAGLGGFSNPREILGLLGKATPLVRLHVPVRIGGDTAFVLGMMKHLLEREAARPGSVLDAAFIAEFTTGFDALADVVRTRDWRELESESGVDRRTMKRAADIYARADSAIATWGLGITHQVNGTDTIGQIINLMLLCGNVGRTGAGLSPMRGHSNILGIRSMGCGTKMPEVFLEKLEHACGIAAPRKPGLDAVDAVDALHGGRARALVCLGGNLASAAPDSAYVAEALRRADLTVMVSTKLNRSHVHAGGAAVILPCLGRSEKEASAGRGFVTVEDAMGHVHASRGCLDPVAPGIRGKTRIVAELARAVLGESSPVAWEELGYDHGAVRGLIEQVASGYAGFAGAVERGVRFSLPNPIRSRDFSAMGGRARFVTPPEHGDVLEPGLFRLMSVRSHDQFNTTIYGLDDRYRGIRNQRRVVFMNQRDMEELGIGEEQAVSISSHHGGQVRTAPPFFAIGHSLPRGCAAVYFPEANALVPRDRRDTATGTPAFKSIPVRIEAV